MANNPEAAKKKLKIDELLQSVASIVIQSIAGISKISVKSISVMGKVTSIGGPEEVRSKQSLIKQDCYFGDASGTYSVVLWQKRINSLAMGLLCRLMEVCQAASVCCGRLQHRNYR